MRFNILHFKATLSALFGAMSVGVASLFSAAACGSGAGLETCTDSLLAVYAAPDLQKAEQPVLEVKLNPHMLEEQIPEADVVKEKTAKKKEYTFKSVKKRAYLLHEAYAKKKPYAKEAGAVRLEKYQSVALIGENDMGYQQIRIDGEIYYLHRDHFTSDKQTIIDMKEEDRKAEEEKNAVPKWNGSKLTASRGVNWGPSGKETYYNLDMSGVIQIMRSIGNTDKYWVREDGCKMLGDYIMVAADLNAHPRGSIIPTSLGAAIVCDTGSFVFSSNTSVDIAVTW